MLVVVASRYDQHAEIFVSRCGDRARLLTCDDLSSKGWRFRLGDDGDSSAVIDGETIDCKEIEGVLTRLPGVFQGELLNIVPEDRGYVAAEMTAFLAAWLSNLDCPVLNRPTPLCLSGPFLRREMWVHTAARIGIPVLPVKRSAPAPAEEAPPPNLTTVSFVGDACVGRVDERLASQTTALARAVGVDLLCARFTGPAEGQLFVDADYWLDLSDAEVADAVLKCLLRGRT